MASAYPYHAFNVDYMNNVKRNFCLFVHPNSVLKKNQWTFVYMGITDKIYMQCVYW